MRRRQGRRPRRSRSRTTTRTSRKTRRSSCRMPNPIALAIPFFFLLIGIEIWAAARRGLKLYRFADVIANLSCGMTQQILLVFQVAALTAGYVWLYDNHRLFTFAPG